MAPPVYVKGGSWSTTEDQILIASIQKYGTHKWNKIASLIPHKTGRQCRERWDQYLNPNVKQQIERPFSKDEETRLIELARIRPGQWLAIGDTLQRPALQCQQHYESLLGEMDGNSLNKNNDLELRARDPHAATRPAIPSETLEGAITTTKENAQGRTTVTTLNEDEREMLAEARARLANTTGKKAQRRARERLREKSRQTARLQRRRELKYAGLAKKSRFSDFNDDEILLEHAPPEGPYDTSLEDQRNAQKLVQYHHKVDHGFLAGQNDNKQGEKRKIAKGQKVEGKVQVDTESILLDEYRKPKFLWSSKNEHVKDEPLKFTIRSRVSTEKQLSKLFAQLPPPLNDFEIILETSDSEPDEDDNNDNTNIFEPSAETNENVSDASDTDNSKSQSEITASDLTFDSAKMPDFNSQESQFEIEEDRSKLLDSINIRLKNIRTLQDMLNDDTNALQTLNNSQSENLILKMNHVRELQTAHHVLYTTIKNDQQAYKGYSDAYTL
ncbi:hypothetical protein TBLA_0B03510 [Henningerozyma blattae CBS 6284]|uniref:Pre-mRNA-splicing factor CEF1 n=1 Tax=Henningerozyma blattae (strain ATCC 34711 / CBS 6284 / DSM 70876 / NBRC 10599 / NRRL Y-10934 / UCD 77-7) TaxID=1071380 RepID=I2GYJ0_HENB6|nr:hypothetical protein TBLA_0B03510 [Tetrapisispora blattae CBS 6284]CCH59192.1 hypothetical protein TBLA_0B03510 [Tetrapisispora blattae CBS 6284]